MKATDSSFDAHAVIHKLKHFLPAQAPLKDFVHHNTLHAFQNLKFEEALKSAAKIFGYHVYLPLSEYRALYTTGRIREDIIEKVILESKGKLEISLWKEKMHHQVFDLSISPRVGCLRNEWRNVYGINLDAMVHPILFRILCSYLDQGISIWSFPINDKGFLSTLCSLEKNSFTSFFKSKRPRKMLLEGHLDLIHLLDIVIGNPDLYEQYLFDQQFRHLGWSGMVSTIEDQPQTLLDPRKISLEELIIFELLLEIDALDFQLGAEWLPLGNKSSVLPVDLFAPVSDSDLNQVLFLWQQAYEWSYYDQVLAGLVLQKNEKTLSKTTTFQAMFCIDDREGSFRRYLEQKDPFCETYGTPGFFGVEFYYVPEHGKSYTKLCPAPMNPKYLIKESGAKTKRQKDLHFNKKSQGLLEGWFIAQTLGFWAAFRLFWNIFKPSMTPATASSFQHMDKVSRLSIQNKNIGDVENDLQIGFTVDEMVQRVESLLHSIGLVKDFAPLVYVIGHGSSSVNNPHYAAYDCGACCGRPGSVNARVFSFMANHVEVRSILAERGLHIPKETQFMGGLHDTTRDEVVFFDEDLLTVANAAHHTLNESTFSIALDANAKERSRRFDSIDSKQSPKAIHEQVKLRSVSLFQPRPELNHATNALCIVGRRALTRGIYLDRRSFFNSYDYHIDPQGKYLFNILKAAAPVCGGINLEYFFSRVDNQKLGAGTKLPHNVMGLFGVANGIDGDLRPGLPSQMIEVHDPIRLMVVVEHFPDVVLEIIQKSSETYEWFLNEWVHLAVIHPETKKLFWFEKGAFIPYQPLTQHLESITDITPLIESNQENFPVYLLS